MFFNIYYFKCCWNVQNLAVDVIGSVNTSSLISFRVNFHVMPAWDTIDCHLMKVACGFNGHCSGIRAKGYISKKLIADCFQIGQCLPLLLFPWTACVHRAICSLKCDWSVILSLWKKTRKPVFFSYAHCLYILQSHIQNLYTETHSCSCSYQDNFTLTDTHWFYSEWNQVCVQLVN